MTEYTFFLKKMAYFRKLYAILAKFNCRVPIPGSDL